jgi:hypothetical protein
MERHLNGCGQIIASSTENVMRGNSDIDVQISVRATRETNFTLSTQLQTQAVFDAGWNSKINGAAGANSALTAAIKAWVLDNLAESTAC